MCPSKESIKCLKVCQGQLNDDSRLFEGIFQEVSTFKSVSKSFKGISQNLQSNLRKIEGYFKGVFSGFNGHLKEFQREFQGSFKDISRVFQGHFMGVSLEF